ncbi:MAG TPA: BTAD domain-containing putative transcriptional regulator [Actinophytocola sp.]|nr:BTAD domain-containing putative transcriptional regulator [Actinophytocola sp.]
MQVWADGRSVDIGTPRQQAVLAALAVDAGQPVSVETLVDRVWNDAPPREVRNVLYSHLSRIRRLLKKVSAGASEPAGLERRSAGYVLQVPLDTIDMHRFALLVGIGKDPNRTGPDRAAALRSAMDLWRGAPLSGLSGDWVEQVRDRWHRKRVDAAVRWGEAELGAARAEVVLGVLADLTIEYPLVEPLEALIVRALSAAGRTAEAIERFALVRRRLADELGVDPGAELRDLHAAILRGELPKAGAPAEPSVARNPGPLAVPAQLPPDVFAFAGREPELRWLDGMARGGPARSATSRIATVSGTAGVGKTSLAVHWAHRVREEFPDGQVYLNLRGFDPAGSPVTAAEAVRALLDAFEVAQDRIPAGLTAQVGLYRSLLADRRVLVVLDNARDAEQVRPLLPGSPSCLVVVTSRNRLAGLVAAGAAPLQLDLLDPESAGAVLAGRIGADRVAAEPAAVDEIVACCARLPLALALAAARAATHPGFTLTALAGELRAARGSLDEFSSDDPATDPRAVFSWSYLRLSDAAARLFRMVGLHPGPEIGVAAAAGLAAAPFGATRQLLAELSRAHLVAEISPGRFGCHDLLRAYAAEEAALVESAADRAAAVRRILAHYLHSAYHADGLLDPRRERLPEITGLPPGVTPERPADRAAALAWFDRERQVLLGAARQGPEFDAEVWELTWTIRRYLAHQGHWADELHALTVGLAAAERLADPVKQAYDHCYLGCTQVWFEDYPRARAALDRAATLYEQAGDHIGQAYVEHYLAWMLERQGENVAALAHSERSLELFVAAGHRSGQAKSLNAVGWFHALLDDHRTSIVHCERALALQTDLGDQLGAAQTWHSLGYCHDHLGDYSKAISCHEAAIDLFRDSGYRFSEAYALTSLGDAHEHAGDHDAARSAWLDAEDIFGQLGHPDVDKVRARLATTLVP